jgi:hypothetical protein
LPSPYFKTNNPGCRKGDQRVGTTKPIPMANITNNRLSITMTAAQITAVKTAVQTIQTNMPFLVGLTVEERMRLPKINVANKAFTEDAINSMVNNPSLLPAYFNVAEMQKDMTLFAQLDELNTLVNQLGERISDTQLLAGSEAYVSALAAYRNFEAAANAGVAGADTIYDLLKSRFCESRRCCNGNNNSINGFTYPQTST